VLRDQALELADELAPVPEGELGIDPLLDRSQTQLLEPRDLALGERLVGEIGERGAAPERQRVPKSPCRTCVLSGRPQPPSFLREALEAI
jgi:hypothetical protein